MAQVADFGLSQPMTEMAFDGIGTLSCMPPELIRGDVITNWEAVDSFGVGCIAHDLAHINTEAPAEEGSSGDGEPALTEHDDRMAVAALLAAARPSAELLHARPVDARVLEPLARVIVLCLAVDPDARPNMTAVRSMLTHNDAAAWLGRAR